MKKLFAYGLAFFVGIAACYHFLGNATEPERVDYTAEDTDWKLPGEIEKRLVTRDEISAELEAIDELAVYQGVYTVEKQAEYSRYILDDIRIPLTKNTISMKCDGIVKVGFEMSDIKIDIDNDNLTIHLSLPEPKVLSNNLDLDTWECAEKNNILNPIESSQYDQLFSEMEVEGLDKIINEGIFEDAEESVRDIITDFLDGYEGYKVVVM